MRERLCAATGRYQRILGEVLLDGQDFNLEQIKQAWHYRQYDRDQLPADRKLYAEAQERESQKQWAMERSGAFRAVGFQAQ